MLTRIIERSLDGGVSALDLEPVNQTNGATDQQDGPDASALTHRIAQLEQALVETESSAYARGRRDAESALHEKVAGSIKNTADQLARSLHDLAAARPKLCKQAESDLLRLAIAVARRILHREISIDPTSLQALVQVCLDRLGRQDQLRVRVNPALADPIRAILLKLSSRNIEVVPDNTLDAGGLIFETARGELDASIQTQLDEIEQGLIDRLKEIP
jgi:flagellar assembly protein FliH